MWHLIPLCCLNVGFSNIVVWLLLSAAQWKEELTCLVLRLGGSQPFCSSISAGSLHLAFSTGCWARPVGFESEILRVIRFILHFLLGLMLDKYLSHAESPGVCRAFSCGWSSVGLNEALAVHEAVAQLGFKYEKGKNKQSFSKPTRSCSYSPCIVGCVCAHTAHTLNGGRIILRPDL